MKRIAALLVLSASFAVAQDAPPPQQPIRAPDSVIKVTGEDRDAIITLQRDLSGAQVQAYQAKAALDQANSDIQARAAALSQKVDSLRKKYKAEGLFFNQEEVGFVKVPTPAPEKKETPNK